MSRDRGRGSALILSLVIAAVLALLATAFIITARVERQAAVNTLYGAQAEAACRAGLASAIYQIELCHKFEEAGVAYSVDASGSWHEHFYSTNLGAPDYSQPLCPDSWVTHYDDTFAKREMTGKRFDLPVSISDPAKTLKTQKGYVSLEGDLRPPRSQYFIAVADLDGKLHCNPSCYDNLLNDAGTQTMIDQLNTPDLTAHLALDKSIHWSLGSLRALLITSGVVDNPATLDINELNDGEKFFTVYPLVTVPDPLPAKIISRTQSQVNVNTARQEVLKAIVLNVPNLAAKAGIVAQKLASKRAAAPFKAFANRKDMEKALIELGDPAWNTNLPAGYSALSKDLDEQQMNDLLNSLAGDNLAAIDNSDLDDVATGGYYHFDFDNDGTSLHSCPDGDSSASWGTEVKFTSQFFHIYTLGRTVLQDGRVVAERRMHAIYDAEADKVLWLRWNFGAKANMTD